MGVAGKEIEARVRGIAGSTLMVVLRTTPKAAAPAPRRAQNKSGWLWALAMRRCPSGVMTVNSRTRSTPMPYRGDSTL